MTEKNDIDKQEKNFIEWCEEHDELIFKIFLIIMLIMCLCTFFTNKCLNNYTSDFCCS